MHVAENYDVSNLSHDNFVKTLQNENLVYYKNRVSGSLPVI